jgi:DNA-binding winged helix-turn-helix (wHTH) protein
MRWKVGSYCFDDQSNELKNTQYSLLLEPKPAAMLHYLVQNTGKDISRDQIMTAVWPNQIVSENAINRIIVQLRKALNDTQKVKRYIVTVPKVGYRFIARCNPLEENLSIPAEIIETNGPNTVSRKTKSTFLVVTLVIVACLVLGYQYIQTDISPSFGSAGYSSPKISPLTRFSDIEFGAELAHDNQQLVYTTREDNGHNTIMYRATPNSQPIRIGQLEGNASNPHWSLDDSQLVYLFKNQSTCEFHIVTIKNAQPSLPKTVYYCALGSDSHFVFTQNKENIVFTEKKSEFSPYIVYELDIKN